MRAFINIENTYLKQIKQVVENIFKKIESDRNDITIIGLFIDPYFIRKQHNDLILVDTRPADTLPRKRKAVQQEFTACEQNTVEGTVHLNIDGSIINDPNSDDDTFFRVLLNRNEETEIPVALRVVTISVS